MRPFRKLFWQLVKIMDFQQPARLFCGRTEPFPRRGTKLFTGRFSHRSPLLIEFLKAMLPNVEMPVQVVKRLNLLLIFGLTMASIAFGGDQSVLARVTVYWRGEGQPQASWNGARLRDGHCAVDPKKVPYGSKVIFGDAAYVAVDTGPAVISRKAARSFGRTTPERNAIVIDLFFESKEQAMIWTKTHPHFMTAQIQTPASRSRDNEVRIAANDSEHGASRPNDDPGIRTSQDRFLGAFEADRMMLASTSLRCLRSSSPPSHDKL
jgi:3D (Asp-Asp-Asp) domain-containing protein